eukprot:gene5942-7878_t
MNYASDTQTMLDQRLKTTGWQIAQTVVLGLLAGCLSLFGQVCLERARPIFPALDQNFAAWQSGYTVVLMVIGIVWLVVLLTQLGRWGLTAANRRRLACLSLFWHFLDVIWIGVFTVVYLMGALR